MNSESHRLNSSLPILIVVLTVYSLLIITFHHYERLTGDATIYLSIAEKYIRGDFSNAINGYWGPLLSWLLIPFLALGSTHVFAINALNLIFGVLTITGVWRLSYRFEINENIRKVILVPMVPILVFVSLIQPMDFLLLCVLVYYLNIVFGKDYPEKISHGAFSGVLGALAYFSKPFGFPFFISHFLLMNACQYFRVPSKAQKRNVLRNALTGFVLFALLSGVWIGLISNKYNRLTFSNMGRGVIASLGPGSKHNTIEKGSPIFTEGFYEPPNDTATVIYEDPSQAKNKVWNPLESRSSLKHYVKNITENIFEGTRIYESFSRLSIAVIIAYIVLFFNQPPGTLFNRMDILYPLLTLMLYTGGYMPFHFEIRYLWIVNILLLLMGGTLLNILFTKEFFNRGITKTIMIVIFILSFIITPVKETIGISKDDINRNMYDLGTELGKRYDIQGNIASNRQKREITTHDSWHHTFRLAYWLKSRYYGQPRENMSDEELVRELEKYNIDYYFYWGEAGRVPQFLYQYKELTGGKVPGLMIYSLRENKS
jgi:hypothetical protein